MPHSRSTQGDPVPSPLVRACHQAIGGRTRADILTTACRTDMRRLPLGQRGQQLPGPPGSLEVCPTATARSGTAGSTRGSPSPGHQAPPWGWGQAEARLGDAGDQPCCSITGAGADSPGEALEAAIPVSARRAASPPSDRYWKPVSQVWSWHPECHSSSIGSQQEHPDLQEANGSAREGFSSSILQVCCPAAWRMCQQLYTSRSNDEFGVSSVLVSHTASSAHDVLETKIAVIHCSSFLIALPS